MSLAAVETCRDPACHVSRMPPEILKHIVDALVMPWDVAAAYMASRLFHARSPIREAIKWGATHTGSLLAAGAPCAVVESALALRTRPMRAKMLVDAVRGGRVDVMRLLMNRILQCARQGDLDADDLCAPIDDRYTRELNPIDDIPIAVNLLVAFLMRRAARYNKTDVLRYLMTTRFYGNRVIVPERVGVLKTAVKTGSLDVVMCMHDRIFSNDDNVCMCDPNIGKAAWRLPTPQMAQWLGEYGCAGYVAPTADDLAHAVAHGHTGMIKHMADRCENVHRTVLEPVVVEAAAAGHVATLDALIKCGVWHDIEPIMIGGARRDFPDVIDWVTSFEDDDCYRHCNAPTDDAWHAAAIEAAANNRVRIVRWIADNKPDVVNDTLMWAAIGRDAVDVVAYVESLLAEPFDWQAAAHLVLTRANRRMAEYAWTRGMQITATAIALTVPLNMRLVAWLCFKDKWTIWAAVEIAIALNPPGVNTFVRCVRAALGISFLGACRRHPLSAVAAAPLASGATTACPKRQGRVPALTHNVGKRRRAPPTDSESSDQESSDQQSSDDDDSSDDRPIDQGVGSGIYGLIHPMRRDGDASARAASHPDKADYVHQEGDRQRKRRRRDDDVV